MRDAPAPRLHLFVCANRREGSPLGPGCGERGEAVYDALKREVGRRGEIATTWVTKTYCLGICPREGATVARWPSGATSAIVTEVAPADVDALLGSREAGAGAGAPRGDEPAVAELSRELAALEELQRKKVLDLARRLKPGLTLEDVQNPHDFPELDDPDWHYADGVLAGVQSVKSALSAMLRGRAKRED
ncbi:MAG: (2Fe-2S) ferredoxin domain-containing protein [Labilithrix sp.]|nr:(2Fe-2S) ferredoxin domain-containing protein [Labilithrix sp.]